MSILLLRYLNPHVWRRAVPACLLAMVLVSAGANAAEAGKDGGGLYVKVAPLMVNLHDRTHFLRANLTLKVANPQLVKTVTANMPVILNELTYLLSDKDAEQFESAADKQMLVEQIRSALNKALSLTARDGVTDIFLESLIVQ